MSEDRFNELLSCLLDGELSTKETAEMIALSEDELRNPGSFWRPSNHGFRRIPS